jgi:hypothetical protein
MPATSGQSSVQGRAALSPQMPATQEHIHMVWRPRTTSGAKWASRPA